MDSCISLQFVSMEEKEEDQSGERLGDSCLKKRTILMSSFVIDIDADGNFSNVKTVKIFRSLKILNILH